MPDVKGYHVHVYFNAASAKDKATAMAVRDKAKADWGEQNVGRLHEKPVGPHTSGSFQIWINLEERQDAIKWTEQNRQGLSAMLHNVTDDEFHDHTEEVTWFGDTQALDKSIFTKMGMGKPKP